MWKIVKIRRENWKSRYTVVARDDKGRFLAYKKWSAEFNIERAKRLFKRNKTFNKDVVKHRLKNVIEVTDFRALKPSKQAAAKFQYFFETTFKGKKISARSMQYDIDIPKNKAREEALENLYARIDQTVNDLIETGDIDEGEQLFQTIGELRRNFREGVVYYRAAV